MKFGKIPDLANEAPAGSAVSGRQRKAKDIPQVCRIQAVRKRISVLFKLYDSRGCVRDGKEDQSAV